MYNIKGKNSTELYYKAMNELYNNGDEVKPRGKLVRELRPAAIEFEDPTNRVTFLGGRRINPFFQIAESLWILSGHADVEFLDKFNANMKNFSDDKIWFNAPYGERIRHWAKNSARGIMDDGLDQLEDVYKRFLHDKDTRQATIAIGNPSFDNYDYLVNQHGLDIACNLYITFKIRKNKLHMTVFNRSNDLHWGTFGANLCQFTTIQETLYSWLKNSGIEDFKDLELGTYTQITDSLHIYMDTYGAKCTEDVIEFYKNNPNIDIDLDFSYENEPQMAMSIEQFNEFIDWFWDTVATKLIDDATFTDESKLNDLIESVELKRNSGLLDSYWYFSVQSMIAYRLAKVGSIDKTLEVMNNMENCQWKISMLYFLKAFILKQKESDSFNKLKAMYELNVDIANNLLNEVYSEQLNNYLKLGE